MTAEVKQEELSFTAKLVVVLTVLLIMTGMIWHDATYEAFRHMWEDLFGRSDGSMSFRFYLQPGMAVLAAIPDGVADARMGRSPYFWSVVNEPEERRQRLNEGLASAARIILLGLVLDLLYQAKEYGMFYPVEALLIGVLLACIPYFLVRGPVTRTVRWWESHPASN